MRASRLRRLMNWWPPFAFSGIRVEHIADDYREVRVALHQRWYNRNYVGSHFGGSLFAMTDPFFMLMLLHALGRDYVVWDKAASIEFVKPGRGTVRARFALDEQTLTTLRDTAHRDGRATHWFTVDVLDAAGEVVARVRKHLYVRPKAATRSPDVRGAR